MRCLDSEPSQNGDANAVVAVEEKPSPPAAHTNGVAPAHEKSHSPVDELMRSPSPPPPKAESVAPTTLPETGSFISRHPVFLIFTFEQNLRRKMTLRLETPLLNHLP